MCYLKVIRSYQLFRKIVKKLIIFEKFINSNKNYTIRSNK